MKKLVILAFILPLLCCGCMEKEFTCSSEKNEDGALTNISVKYNFSIFGKQQARKEKTTIQFENPDDFYYYYDYTKEVYNNSNNELLYYDIQKNEKNFTIEISRNLTLSDIDHTLKEELEPTEKLTRKKIKEYYTDMGYQCN